MVLAMRRTAAEIAESLGTVEPLLLTPDQAAKLCRVSRSKLDEWTYRTGFPVIRDAGTVRIHAGLLDEWLRERAKQNRVESTAYETSAELPARATRPAPARPLPPIGPKPKGRLRQIMRIRDTAAYLGVQARVVSKWLDDGRFPEASRTSSGFAVIPMDAVLEVARQIAAGELKAE
jgi:excisionase family DNA binding protein